MYKHTYEWQAFFYGLIKLNECLNNIYGKVNILTGWMQFNYFKLLENKICFCAVVCCYSCCCCCYATNEMIEFNKNRTINLLWLN